MACSESTASSGDGERDDDQNRRDCERGLHAGGNDLWMRRCDVDRRRCEREHSAHSGCTGDETEIARQVEQAGNHAAMLTLIAQANPEESEDSLFERLREIRPQAWPNSRMIAFADDLLGRNGRLTDALTRHYRHQVKALPHYTEWMTKLFAMSGPRHIVLPMSGACHERTLAASLTGPRTSKWETRQPGFAMSGPHPFGGSRRAYVERRISVFAGRLGSATFRALSMPATGSLSGSRSPT
jgi:hypothetical protein